MLFKAFRLCFYMNLLKFQDIYDPNHRMDSILENMIYYKNAFISNEKRLISGKIKL